MSGAWTRLLVAAALTCTCQALVIEPRQSVAPRTAYDGTASDASGDACLSLSAEDCSLSSLLSLRGGSLSTWWYKTLAKLGIFLKKGRLLVLGLDNAGKSTLLTVLLRNEVVPTAPTHQPVTDEVCVLCVVSLPMSLSLLPHDRPAHQLCPLLTDFSTRAQPRPTPNTYSLADQDRPHEGSCGRHGRARDRTQNVAAVQP